jgi:hypothetical protein
LTFRWNWFIIFDNTASLEFDIGVRHYDILGHSTMSYLNASKIKALRILGHKDEERREIMEATNILESPKDTSQEVVDFLTKPGLVDRIVDDITVLGCVGERKNKLLVYIVTISRKMATPLACIVRGDSSGGKSHLLETTTKLTPDEEKKIITRATKQAFFYENNDNFANKLVYIRESAGSEEAAYIIRTLISEKELILKRPIGKKN